VIDVGGCAVLQLKGDFWIDILKPIRSRLGHAQAIERQPRELADTDVDE